MTRPDDEEFLRKLYADLEVLKERQSNINAAVGRAEKALEPVSQLVHRVTELEEIREARIQWVQEAIRFVITGVVLTALGFALQQFGVELVVF